MIDVDELERLEREATPGPWKVQFDQGGGWGGTYFGRDQSPSISGPDTCDEDGRLIEAARNALPDLLAELRTLRAKVAGQERDAALGVKVREAVGTMTGREILWSFGDLRTERGDFYVVKDVRLLHALRALAETIDAEQTADGD